MSSPSVAYFTVTGLALAVGLASLDPDSSRGLSFTGRFLYWLLHVGTALLVLGALQRAFRPRRPTRGARSGLRVLAVGLLGGCAFVPLAAQLERPFFAEPGSELLEEALEVMPQVLSFWAVLNLPFLFRREEAVEAEAAETADAHQKSPAARPGRVTEEPGAHPAPEPSGPVTELTTSSLTSKLDELPPALGRRVLAISSELHYVRVYTDRGNVLLLGSLKGLIDSDDVPGGLQIHRSHWVAEDAVVELARISGSLVCRLSNGLELPVSRRRSRVAREVFGNAVYGSSVTTSKEKGSPKLSDS